MDLMNEQLLFSAMFLKSVPILSVQSTIVVLFASDNIYVLPLGQFNCSFEIFRMSKKRLFSVTVFDSDSNNSSLSNMRFFFVQLNVMYNFENSPNSVQYRLSRRTIVLSRVKIANFLFVECKRPTFRNSFVTLEH